MKNKTFPKTAVYK